MSDDRCRKFDLNAEDVLAIRKAYLLLLLKVVTLSALAFSNLSITKQLKQRLQSGLGGYNRLKNRVSSSLNYNYSF